jgi:ATP-dependent Clp protease ATP-binding subunit ClpA
MFQRFTEDARAVVQEAHDEARRRASRTIEAEHLLLALAARGIAGLDHATIDAALDEEERVSLAAAGVSWEDFDPTPRHTDFKQKLGASAKAALGETLKVALAREDKNLTSPHLLIAILSAERGTVPRALDVAGLDREDMRLAAAAAIP